MVVREDGTKWACQSCLKGHRVSGCTHTDRELTLVPKKGRPVTQCHHCRLERKKRSAHVRCDCGEAEKPHHSREKCIHLREAEERSKTGFRDDHLDPHHLAAVAEEQGCCCHHGGKCSCAMMKKEDDSMPHGPAVPKPRLESTRSDGSITVFANGHHKSVHRKNHAAHECGMPYKMPLARAHTDQNVSTAARRSVDSLMLDSTQAKPLAPFSGQPPASTRSEQTSPRLAPRTKCNGGLMDDQLASVEFGDAMNSWQRSSIGSTDMMAFPALDPMSAATEGAFDPWSVFPSADSTMPNNNPFGAWPTVQDGSVFGQPALTAASSGTQSEIDEIPPSEDFYGFMPSIKEDEVDATNGTNGVNRHSLPPGFFGNTNFSIPMTAEEWQAAMTGTVNDSKIKSPNSGNFGMIENWTASTMSNSVTSKTMNGQPISTRPQSHSIGPGSAPDEDIIKQLFPLDVGDNTYDSGITTASNHSPASWNELMCGAPDGINTSASIDFSPDFEDENGLTTTTTWPDETGALSAETYNTTFNIDQDFSTPDFSGPWVQ